MRGWRGECAGGVGGGESVQGAWVEGRVCVCVCEGVSKGTRGGGMSV